MPNYTREEPRRRFICKICKTPVISRTNLKAIYGREHGKHCERRFR